MDVPNFVMIQSEVTSIVCILLQQCPPAFYCLSFNSWCGNFGGEILNFEFEGMELSAWKAIPRLDKTMCWVSHDAKRILVMSSVGRVWMTFVFKVLKSSGMK